MDHQLSLSYAEAEHLCAQYQHLIGRMQICQHTDFCVIENILVAPEDELNKWIFANRYFDGTPVKECMDFYHGPYYDILVLGRNVKDNNTIVYESLQNYLQHDCIDLTIEQVPSYLL